MHTPTHTHLRTIYCKQSNYWHAGEIDWEQGEHAKLHRVTRPMRRKCDPHRSYTPSYLVIYCLFIYYKNIFYTVLVALPETYRCLETYKRKTSVTSDCFGVRIITRHNKLQSSGHTAHVMSCSIIQYKRPGRWNEPSFLVRSMIHTHTRLICTEWLGFAKTSLVDIPFYNFIALLYYSLFMVSAVLVQATSL